MINYTENNAKCNIFAQINIYTTPARTLSISGLKSRVLITIFDLKMMVKSVLEFFYFEILRATSEIPPNLPGQFSHYGQTFLHWAAATLKGMAIRVVEFSNGVYKIRKNFA